MKIRDTEVGQTVTIPLLVKSAEIKLTRGGKPYLFAMLSDGTDDLQGQDWDFGNGKPPAKNTVLDVTGTIGEYMGKKQIKIQTFEVSNLGVEQFAPSGNVNIEDYISKAKDLMAEINNPQVYDVVSQVFNDYAKAWKITPAASGMHHAYVSGLLQHTVDVALKAKAIATLTPGASMDLVIAGALLHDFGKLWTYTLNGALIEMTDQGQMIEHIMIGAIKIEAYRNDTNSDIIDLLQHIISSHHGVLEYGSPTTPRFIEAVIVNFADGVDAKCQMLIEANAKLSAEAKFTDKLWAMGNKPMFTQAYVSKVMTEEAE